MSDELALEFKRWAKSKELDLIPNRNTTVFPEITYGSIETEMFWECWQAAIIAQHALIPDAAVRELIDAALNLLSEDNLSSKMYGGHWQQVRLDSIDRLRNALAHLAVKG